MTWTWTQPESGVKVVSTQVVAPDRPVVLPDTIARAAGVEPGDTLIIESTEPGRIGIRVLPRMTLEAFVERFRVDAPNDEAAIREEAEDDAFRESFGHLLCAKNG
jgi:bifunctional DNA-binding transcriptional regulator/antitoxin component of YhaV-PrlF toxin-antitoxin module